MRKVIAILSVLLVTTLSAQAQLPKDSAKISQFVAKAFSVQLKGDSSNIVKHDTDLAILADSCLPSFKVVKDFQGGLWSAYIVKAQDDCYKFFCYKSDSIGNDTKDELFVFTVTVAKGNHNEWHNLIPSANNGQPALGYKKFNEWHQTITFKSDTQLSNVTLAVTSALQYDESVKGYLCPAIRYAYQHGNVVDNSHNLASK